MEITNQETLDGQLQLSNKPIRGGTVRDIFIANSYAGSLVLGAQATGLPIRMSVEDSGYGIAGQRLNWPGLRYVDRLPWPNEDLSNSICIAHPPCSAWSNMNIVADKRGLDTSAVRCHEQVMKYCFENHCEALAIESVQGAAAFADSFYRVWAERYHYRCCFVLLNAISFGVPQWRPRFWALFFRDFDTFGFSLQPNYVNLQAILTGEPATDPVTLKHESYLKRKYDAGGFDFGAMMRAESVGGFDTVAKAYFGEKDSERVKELTGTRGLYRAGLPRKLDVTLWAPVVLGFSLWYVGDRALNQTEYHRIMGFPDDYRWTEKMGKDFLTYLSKGVCPPVATWVLQQMMVNLTDTETRGTVTHGQTVDLQPQKQAVADVLRGIRKPMSDYAIIGVGTIKNVERVMVTNNLGQKVLEVKARWVAHEGCNHVVGWPCLLCDERAILGGTLAPTLEQGEPPVAQPASRLVPEENYLRPLERVSPAEKSAIEAQNYVADSSFVAGPSAWGRE